MNEREIFAAVLERPTEAERQAFLTEVCDGEMRQRIERLLKKQSQLGSFLDHPPLESDPAALNLNTPTIVMGEHSTCDDDGDPNPLGQINMRQNSQDDDDEIPLGYLEPSSKPNSLGRLGHYEILEVVGRGAFGTVLRAFDEKLQRVVAIKVLAPEMAATSPARKRFLREARTSAAIRHENVVAIHAVEDEPIPYLVMEYIPGQTLQQRLDKSGPLSVLDALKLGKQIADGLAAAHAHDLIHRDIKPGNILLERGTNERVKISDFGLARTADDASMSQSGLIAGTPMYMAPEQALGHKLDQRADLFSFGSVLYQMLSGRPPFRAASTVAVLKRVVDDAPRPIQEIIPEVPTWMCEVVSQLHAKNPDDRIQTAKEVSDLLGQCLDDLKAGRVPKISSPSLNTAVTELRPAMASGLSETPRVSKKPLVRLAASALILLGIFGITEATGVTNLASTGIRLATGSGTLVIETDDPGVKIAINGEEVTIKGGGVEELTLRPGEYKVAALKDGQPVKQELVSITRNGRTVVRMSLEAGKTNTRSAGSAQVASGSAVPDYALTFDGTDDSIQTPVRFDVAKPLTVEAIITVPDKPGHNQVALADAELGGFGLGPRENGKWRMDLQSQAGKQRDEVGYVRLESDNAIAYGTRTHVATTYDGRILRLYVDGRLQSKRLPVKDLVPSSLPIMIGANPGLKNKTAEHFFGTIDEVRISSVARYTGDFTPDKRFESDEHTLALYHFDEGTGDVLKDSSGNGHHGKIVGAKWVRVDDESRGWVQLFNGKDLTGWKTHPELPGHFEVKEGVLIGSQRRTFLFSERGDYENFHLRAEARINLGGDSGIFFRSGFGIQRGTEFWQLAPASGFEAQIHKNQNVPFPTGSVSQVGNHAPPIQLGRAPDDSLTRPDEWFTIEVIANQNRITTKVNGTETVSCSSSSTENSKGHIALQVWDANTAIQFRKIEIKELPLSSHDGAQPLAATFKNSIGMEFVIVPKGKSWLGGGKDKLGNKEVEIPADFYLGKYEVTQEEWTQVMGENPSHFSRTGAGKDAVMEVSDEDLKRLPVETVSWDECQRFVAKLNEREKEMGWVYRLPTATEWEYACRGGPMTDNANSAFDFYFAKPTNNPLREQSSFGKNMGLNRTVRVGSHEANALGIFDMHRNVWEWCDDGKEAADGNSQRAQMGGGWNHIRSRSAAANIELHLPSHRSNALGLRLARVPTGARSPEVKTPRPAMAPFDAAQAQTHQEAWAKHLGVPVEYTNSIGMKFRLIPPGEFQMGSNPEEIEAALLEAAEINPEWKEHIRGESPRHRVVLTQPFYLGAHEVTQAEYQQMTGTNPSYFGPKGAGKDLVAGVDIARFPVEMVSWHDAANFCIRLSEKEALSPCYSRVEESTKLAEGTGYRMPTEAEWEFACRAGTSTRFSNGNGIENLMKIGWFSDNSTGRSHAVGELPANPLGLHDMHGNVWEWVQDGWDPRFYASSNEQNSSNPLSSIDVSASRGVRGGNWYVPAMHCRAADRGAFDAKDVYGTVGFRVSLSVDAVKAAIANRSPTPPKASTNLP